MTLLRNTALLIFAIAFAPFAMSNTGEKIESALIILSSSSLQTQGMAMVLGNTMQQSGTKVDVLLCDGAGDLALKDHNSPSLKPRNVTPEQLMMKLQKGGASVYVCALYLPNGGASETDLREGITAAKPPQIAGLMTNKQVRVFSF